MASYKPEKLHVKYTPEMEGAKLQRRYTLTHSDRTGELYLTIARDYDQEAISDWYTRLMRDEVLGEWQEQHGWDLHIQCHVSGGFVLGPAKWRDAIFKGHLPMALEAIVNGDGEFISGEPDFRSAPILVHFHAKQDALNRVEDWGFLQDYLINNCSYSNS